MKLHLRESDAVRVRPGVRAPSAISWDCHEYKDWACLIEHWSRIDEVYGNSIMTRLRDCALIEMF